MDEEVAVDTAQSYTKILDLDLQLGLAVLQTRHSLCKSHWWAARPDPDMGFEVCGVCCERENDGAISASTATGMSTSTSSRAVVFRSSVRLCGLVL